MVAPRDYFQDGKGASEILKNSKSYLYSELVYCRRSATHFVSLAQEINNIMMYLVKICVKENKNKVTGQQPSD